MIGSVAIATFVAQAGFWILLAIGVFTVALGWRPVVVFLVLWIGGRAALTATPLGVALFPPYVAMLDIALVLLIFKGDVRIT